LIADEAQEISLGYLNVDNVNDGTAGEGFIKTEKLGVEY